LAQKHDKHIWGKKALAFGKHGQLEDAIQPKRKKQQTQIVAHSSAEFDA